PGDWEVIMDRRTVFSWFIIPDAVTPTGDYALKFGVRHSDALEDTLSSVAHDQVALFFDHWYHIAVGYDGSTARMWVGPYVVDSTSTGSWELTASTNAMNIGARHWGSYERQLHGALDEIRVLTDVPDPGDLELNRNGTQYSTNSATLLLIHLDNDSPDPVYLTGTGLISSLFGNSISSPDYIDITSDLPFDNSNTNRAPFIYPVSARSGGEGELLEFTLYAYDETESVLTWEAVSNLPAGAAFEQSDNNGSFSWTPSIQQSGNYSLSFQVSDGETVSRVYFGSGGKKIENRR
ncbi:MAG: LamG-like jellyroll fold domain-containing protein, partial [Candidatus Marinimicrobia bacterium]|nr:LamG-like jellyroll fold domain-containing protein [Candidatus Neomarinimicrobiota bacterium]